MRRGLFALLATALLWSCGGDDREDDRGGACLLPYQFCGLALHFDAGSWSPGSWKFEVEADGDLHSCTLELPIEIASKQSCGNNSTLAPLRNDEEKAAYPFRFELSSAPANATIRLWYEGELAETRNIKPRYDKNHFRGCDDDCLVHEAEVSF